MSAFVSVIIPVYNDPVGLSETLGALAIQDYPTNRWQAIVVDNDSTDDTLDVAKSFSDRMRNLKILVERSRQSSYAARNRGIEQAKGDILAFIDADMTVGRNWISSGVASILSQRGDYIGSRVDIYTRRSPPNIWEIYNQHTGFPIRQYVEKEGYTTAGSLFIRRAVFDKLGMFDERLISSGDIEFGNRVKASGFTLYYDHENAMKHPARSSLRSIWRKYSRIGKGNVDLRYYYPDRYGRLKRRYILPIFRPAVRVSTILDASGLSLGWKCKMLFAENIVRLAKACGQTVRYVQTRGGKRSLIE